MIEIIEIQKDKYTMLIHGAFCIFMKPMCLYLGNSIMPLRPFVPAGKSVIKWKINGKFVSYRQIKAALLSQAQADHARCTSPGAKAAVQSEIPAVARIDLAIAASGSSPTEMLLQTLAHQTAGVS